MVETLSINKPTTLPEKGQTWYRNKNKRNEVVYVDEVKKSTVKVKRDVDAKDSRTIALPAFLKEFKLRS
jgi:hypothetical protein